jgi:hypothetical protein
VAVPEFVPSDAVTVWSPRGLTGTVNGQLLKVPLASGVQDVETPLPSKAKVIRLSGAKPLPLSEALSAAGPTLALRLMAGVTVNV